MRGPGELPVPGSCQAGSDKVNDCTACEGTGVVAVPAHVAACTPLRCAGDCPQPELRQCARCATAQLGEDLAG